MKEELQKLQEAYEEVISEADLAQRIVNTKNKIKDLKAKLSSSARSPGEKQDAKNMIKEVQKRLKDLEAELRDQNK